MPGPSPPRDDHRRAAVHRFDLHCEFPVTWAHHRASDRPWVSKMTILVILCLILFAMICPLSPPLARQTRVDRKGWQPNRSRHGSGSGRHEYPTDAEHTEKPGHTTPTEADREVVQRSSLPNRRASRKLPVCTGAQTRAPQANRVNAAFPIPLIDAGLQESAPTNRKRTNDTTSPSTPPVNGANSCQDADQPQSPPVDTSVISGNRSDTLHTSSNDTPPGDAPTETATFDDGPDNLDSPRTGATDSGFAADDIDYNINDIAGRDREDPQGDTSQLFDDLPFDEDDLPLDDPDIGHPGEGNDPPDRDPRGIESTADGTPDNGFDIDDFDPDIVPSPLGDDDDGPEPDASHASEEKAARVSSLLDFRTTLERKAATVYLTEFFEQHTHSSTFRAITRLAEQKMDFETLRAMVEVRLIWMQRSDWWVRRTGRGYVSTSGASALTWIAALKICRARRDYPVEAMIDDEWLDEWLLLSRGMSGYWNFPSYIEEKIAIDGRCRFYHDWTCESSHDDSLSIEQDYAWRGKFSRAIYIESLETQVARIS